jgi:hypothetical protein
LEAQFNSSGRMHRALVAEVDETRQLWAAAIVSTLDMCPVIFFSVFLLFSGCQRPVDRLDCCLNVER